MKLKTEKKDFQSLGAESKQFSVDTSDTMVIRLLRDKMYKNKIGAVAREIASNSRDANREAGRGDTPIVIAIQNEQNGLLAENTLSISFKDNGIGISPERMDKIFLKYGSSTKRDTDEFTGGFGIGAKTPFAYSDNFFISTIVEENGVRTKYQYQAVITSDGKREVSRMLSLGEETTKEQTGTEIIVPIKNSEDREKFEYEVLYATMLWGTKPTLKGFTNLFSIDTDETHKLKKVYETDNYLIIEDKKDFYGDYRHIALIDGIPYVINSNNLKLKTSRGNSNIVYVHKFNTGEISVSGSREDIEYIEENKIKLEQSVELILEEGRVLIDKFLNDVSSYKEACVHSNAINSAKSFYSYRYNNLELKNYENGYLDFLGTVAGIIDLDDKDIYIEFEGIKRVQKPEFKTLAFNYYGLKSGRMCKIGNLSYSSIDDSKWKMPMFFMDLSKAEPTRNAMLKHKYPNGYIIVNKVKKEEIYWNRSLTETQVETQYKQFEERDNQMLELFDIKFSNYSSVEKLRNVGDKKRNVTDIITVNFRVYKKQNWSKSWEGVTCKYDKVEKTFDNILEVSKNVVEQNNITELAYFVSDKLSDFNETTNTLWDSVPAMSKQQNSIRQLLLEMGILVIGVSSSKEDYFVDAEIPTMADAFKVVMENKVASQNLMEVIEYQLIKNAHFNASVYKSLKVDEETKSALVNLYKKYILTFGKVNNDSGVRRINNLLEGVNEEFINELGLKLNAKFKKDFDKVNEFTSENPMVNLIAKIETTDKYNYSISPKAPSVQTAILDYVSKFNK
jgi:hypothetical protein